MKDRVCKTRLSILIGVILMLKSYGCAKETIYAKYESKDPNLSVSMDYISGWSFQEYRGPENAFTSALFQNDKEEKAFKAKMVLTVIEVAKIGVNPPNPEAVSEDTIAKRLKFKDARLISKSKKNILGLESYNITVSYKTMDKLYSPDAKLIPVTERIVIFKRNAKFYTFRYENTEDEFDKFKRAFEHCLESIKFKDNR